MDASVVGRIRNTNLLHTKALYPLFEAISNSIHAIEDDKLEEGLIEIRVRRDEQQNIDANENAAVTGFDITDNGVGFTDENFKSFSTADSQYKLARGGKGVGRFLWLKAFSYVRVKSIFRTPDGLAKRAFLFKPTQGGIEDPSLENLESGDRRTTVSLIDCKSGYLENLPKNLQTIGHRIVEHHLESFVLGRAPRILLIDGNDTIDVWEIYEEVVSESSEIELRVRDETLRIRHFLLSARADLQHKLYFCGNDRVVTELTLSKHITDLVTPLLGRSGENVMYAGYVSGSVLDQHINTERTGFTLRAESTLPSGQLRLDEDPPWSEIQGAATEAAESYLNDLLQPVREEKEARISRYVTEEAPQYRYLLKHHSNAVKAIPPSLSKNRLDMRLYELSKRAEVETREKAQSLLKDAADEHVDLETAIREKYSQFLEEWNDLAKADLAKYIVHRKSALELLSALLRRRDGAYALEETVHKVIFPLRSTSDDLSFEDQNLWILDEKLAYHHYLASDTPLTKIHVVENKHRDRPDLLVFNRPIAVVEEGQPFSSVVIFEFKRPLRDDYTDDDNPIVQVYDYVRKLRSGDAVDRHGRPVNLPDSVPFYCYVVADLTSSLKTQAENAQLTSTPDGQGYFGYNSNIRAYVEVASFDKVIDDAKRRNAILFDKLNLFDLANLPSNASKTT